MQAAQTGEQIDHCHVLDHELLVVRDHVNGVWRTGNAARRENSGAFLRLEGNVPELSFAVPSAQISDGDIAEFADAVEDDRYRCVAGHATPTASNGQRRIHRHRHRRAGLTIR